MNRLFVLKDVAYAAKTGGGTIAGANELNVLASGALALLNDKGELITETTGVVDADKIADSKYFILAAGRPSGVQVINQIPRQDVFELNRKDYVEPVAMVITAGGTDAATALTFPESEGEVVFKVYDDSFSSRWNAHQMNVSAFKRASETNESVVDRIVAKLNATDSFVIATKVGGGTANMGITVSPKNPRTTISVALSGTFEGNSIETTTAQVFGDGVGEDVYQLEKDFSVELGNGNYIDYGGDHYKQALSTDASLNYDMINFLWEGRHSSPTRSHNVMRNRIVIALPDGAATLTIATIMNYLASLVGEAYDKATGEEPAADDGTANDGVAGN